MTVAHCYLTVILWVQALALDQGTALLGRELLAASRLRRSLLAAPRAALRGFCTAPPPAPVTKALVSCNRELYWWHAAGRPQVVCQDHWEERPEVARRYRYVLSCKAQALGQTLQLPLLSVAVFR